MEIPIGIRGYQLESGDTNYTLLVPQAKLNEKREKIEQFHRIIPRLLRIRCGRQHTNPQESSTNIAFILGN